MLRRPGPSLLLLALGLASGVLVARLPPDLETTVVTRRHHGADPLLSAVLLRFGVDSLLHHPSRYFQPPIFFPDPQRGTEPLVAEALLAVPFRLALGDRPAVVFTWVKIVTPGEITRPEGLLLVAPGDGAVSAVELDYGRGRFGRVLSSPRVLGLVGDEWLDVTEDPPATTSAHAPRISC